MPVAAAVADFVPAYCADSRLYDFLLLISYYIKVPVWFLALFQVLPILAGSTGWVVFFMHVAKGRAKNADPVWLGLLAGSLIIYTLGFAILSMRHSLR